MRLSGLRIWLSFGLPDRRVNADSGAVVAAVGEGGQAGCGGGVQRAQDVCAGGGQIVDGAGFDLGDPQRQAAGRRQRLEVAGVLVGLAGVPGVDGFALDADGLLGAAVGGDQGAVQDHIGQSLGVGAVQRLVQIGGLSRQDVDALVRCSGRRWRGRRGGRGRVWGCRARPGTSAGPCTACQNGVKARLPLGVPTRRRSSRKSRATW